MRPPPLPQPSRVKKILSSLGVVGVLLLKFGKFLPIFLKTGGTMLLSMWAYGLLFGKIFAIGFVLLLLVHECGHLLAAKRVGLKVGLPVFIPFMGALIALKQAPRNVWIEAQVGISGPILGSLGALCCIPIYMTTGNPLFMALAHTGFFLNLFNLVPIGMLDGGRIVGAISPKLWIAGTLIMGVMIVRSLMAHMYFNPIVIFIFVMALPRVFSLFRKRTEVEERYYEVTPAQRLLMSALYFGLAGLLALGMKLSYVQL